MTIRAVLVEDGPDTLLVAGILGSQARDRNQAKQAGREPDAAHAHILNPGASTHKPGRSAHTAYCGSILFFLSAASIVPCFDSPVGSVLSAKSATSWSKADPICLL